MVILVVLIALVLAAPYVYQLFRKDNTINFKDFDKAAAQLNKEGANSGFDPDKEISKSKEIAEQKSLYPFNPNNLTEAQWQQLGLTQQQARAIKHYEEKGGRFYTKEDVKKMYALSADDYKRLEPYITIPDIPAMAKKIKPGEVIELNSADEIALIRLKGVGSASAILIIRYRGRLGGFYKKEQLKEVYGIDSSRYEELKSQVTVNPNKIKKIPVNTVSFDQLRLFPYLTYKQVNAIIEYRKQHGNYTSIDDMKNILLLDEKNLRKIEPYLSFK